MDILEQFKQGQVKGLKHPDLKAGDTVRVYSKVTEGKKTRIQAFEGVVLGIRGSGPSKTVTVRRLSGGFSVERIFPLASPLIDKIDVVRRQKARRARLTYLRQDKKRRRTKAEEESGEETATASPEKPVAATPEPKIEESPAQADKAAKPK